MGLIRSDICPSLLTSQRRKQQTVKIPKPPN